jgi:microcompartment protein CcmL/EutN
VLIGGEVGSVQESLAAGLTAASNSLVDHVYLPGVHPAVVEGVASIRRPQLDEALGIVETATAAAALQAADAGLKAAQVTLLELRLADGLGGKGLAFLAGRVSDVEAAVDAGCRALDGGQLVNAIVIPQLHPEMVENLLGATRFRDMIAQHTPPEND